MITMMAYIFRQGDLSKSDLQVNRGSDFKAWKTQWEAYLSLSGLADQEQAKQVQALTLCFSHEMVAIVDNLGLTAAQHRNAKQIVEVSSQYVKGQINESVEMPLSPTPPTVRQILQWLLSQLTGTSQDL